MPSAFLLLVGAAVGGGVLACSLLGSYFGFSVAFLAALCTAVPVLLTGGIHLDGYCDTVDALSSYQPPERKLEILKDSNAGAFAVTRCGMYDLLYFGAMTMLVGTRTLWPVAIGFILSRALSGLAVLHFRSARAGTAASFQQAADKRRVTVVLVLFVVLAAAAMLLCSLPIGVICLCCAGFAFWRYRVVSYREFGGITGDLAGYFLQSCELFMALGAAVTGEILQWLS
jgi:adenosylcobinamide-GDP ribazoletransferase